MASRLMSWVPQSVARCNRGNKLDAILTTRRLSGEKRVTKGLVLGVYQNEVGKELKFTASAENFDDRSGGRLIEVLKECGFSGQMGAVKMFNDIDDEFRALAVVGLGREGVGWNESEMIEEGMENVRIAAGVGARSLQMQGCNQVFVDPMEYPEQAAEGSSLATWRYNDNKRKQDRTKIPKLELYDSVDVDSWTRGLFKAEAQNLARRLSEAPANQMTPTTFAQAANDALCPCGVLVEMRSMEWIEDHNLNSFLMVAKGSCEPPVFLEITYSGAAAEDKPILLLGKGITFDSGGISLRPCKGMEEYRGGMAGAAVVVATIRAIAVLSLPINVSAVIPLCESMPSGMACKPGDVIPMLNGKTMAVRDIRMAGVVAMFDPMLYAQATYRPRLVVDVATMGDGVRRALGASATGVFSNSHYIWKQFEKAGSLTGDRMWRLPLWKYFHHLVTNNGSFDISNDGYGPASSCISAAILHETVPCVDWAHLDIHGVGMLNHHGATPYLLRGSMTGRPTRTIIQFLIQMACPEAARR